MKWLLFLLLILIPLGIIVAAEFYGEEGPLAMVKENINDRLHVYRNTSGDTVVVQSDAFDVEDSLRAELNDTFPEDMSSFIDRFESEVTILQEKYGNVSEITEIKNNLEEARTKLRAGGDENYVTAEKLVEEAIGKYFSLQQQVG